MKPFTVLSLFDGIAGARLAIERAGLPLAAYYASEINPYAIKVAEHNWPDIREIGNVKLLSWLGFPVDLLIGGSPCQGFSKVGTQLNFEDKRSKLFFEFIRIKQMVNPTWWLLENVVMKQEWQDIISGYLGVEPRLINSAAFSAQSRPRHYWTNIPIADDAESPIWTWREMDNKLDWVLLDDWKEIEPLFLSQRELDYMNRATKDGRTHWDFQHHSEWDNMKSACVVANFKKGVPYNVLVDRAGIRKFHPIEVERLQTYPDNYTAEPNISKTRRYEMLGNAFTVDVIAYILEGVKKNERRSS